MTATVHRDVKPDNVPQRWSRDRIDRLAMSDPAALHLAIERGDLSRAHLSHAAETIGRHPWGNGLEILRGLLRHESPLVREGALYGLAYWLAGDADPEAIAEVRAVAESDPSPGVRETAGVVLADLEDE
jgi:hypothetical protein